MTPQQMPPEPAPTEPRRRDSTTPASVTPPAATTPAATTPAATTPAATTPAATTPANGTPPAGHELPRRTLLTGIAGLGLAISAAIASLTAGFLTSTTRRHGGSTRVRIGALAGLTTDYRRQVVAVTSREAWAERTERIVIYARRDGATPVVILARCSHMGCTVAWTEEHDEFRCPCHAGVFDRQGAVVSGPPPGPLQRLETEVRSGTVYAEFLEA